VRSLRQYDTVPSIKLFKACATVYQQVLSVRLNSFYSAVFMKNNYSSRKIILNENRKIWAIDCRYSINSINNSQQLQKRKKHTAILSIPK